MWDEPGGAPLIPILTLWQRDLCPCLVYPWKTLDDVVMEVNQRMASTEVLQVVRVFSFADRGRLMLLQPHGPKQPVSCTKSAGQKELRPDSCAFPRHL
jgi:hypothetical protein